ncbi:universal stress protein [Ramlibacter solisilvae]|uniref:Universal stress protein n=1 Tax=Ramlibacter tataouinensis TaxID=94132 RepID=A0A127JRF0_9BURK|nr:universal stress protein [Ramlibacter tataouinensis]AMO22551.1 universal stress protein UspA [Ramlibacter tataouinensis]
MPAYKRILIPVDGSDTSSKALLAALQLARDAGGRVLVLHSLEQATHVISYEYVGQVMNAARDVAAKVLDDAVEVAKAAGVEAESKLIDGKGRRLGQAVADAATEWQADLIVVGTHGRHGFSRMLLGSGAEQVIRLAPTPVLVIRGEESA